MEESKFKKIDNLLYSNLTGYVKNSIEQLKELDALIKKDEPELSECHKRLLDTFNEIEKILDKIK